MHIHRRRSPSEYDSENNEIYSTHAAQWNIKKDKTPWFFTLLGTIFCLFSATFPQNVALGTNNKSKFRGGGLKIMEWRIFPLRYITEEKIPLKIGNFDILLKEKSVYIPWTRLPSAQYPRREGNQKWETHRDQTARPKRRTPLELPCTQPRDTPKGWRAVLATPIELYGRQTQRLYIRYKAKV